MSARMFIAAKCILLKCALERLLLTVARIVSTTRIRIHIRDLSRLLLRLRVALGSFDWSRMINITSLLAVNHTLATLTLSIDWIIWSIEELITHSSLVVVMHTLVQSIVILWDVVIRCSLILAYILIRSAHGCARLVFGYKILLEQELLIIDIITLFTHSIRSRLS